MKVSVGGLASGRVGLDLHSSRRGAFAEETNRPRQARQNGAHLRTG
jgi:hypothetical protein